MRILPRQQGAHWEPHGWDGDSAGKVAHPLTAPVPYLERVHLLQRHALVPQAIQQLRLAGAARLALGPGRAHALVAAGGGRQVVKLTSGNHAARSELTIGWMMSNALGMPRGRKHIQLSAHLRR